MVRLPLPRQTSDSLALELWTTFRRSLSGWLINQLAKTNAKSWVLWVLSSSCQIFVELISFINLRMHSLTEGKKQYFNCCSQWCLDHYPELLWKDKIWWNPQLDYQIVKLSLNKNLHPLPPKYSSLVEMHYLFVKCQILFSLPLLLHKHFDACHSCRAGCTHIHKSSCIFSELCLSQSSVMEWFFSSYTQTLYLTETVRSFLCYLMSRNKLKKQLWCS